MRDCSKIGSVSLGWQIEKILKYCSSVTREFYESVTQMKKYSLGYHQTR